MKDSLQRFVFEHMPVRGEFVHLEATWQAVLERHAYPLPLRNVLGELMSASALLAATLKFDGSVILQLHGDGPVTLAVAECTSDMTLRATAKWNADAPAGDLSSLLGAGRFVITLAPRETGQTYQGVVDVRGTVATCLEHYMQHSEQLETRLWLAADQTCAAGLLLQQLPDASSGDPDDWRRVAQLAATVRPRELLGVPLEALLHRLFHEDDVRVFEPRITAFRCSCSTERVVSMLRMLGQQEVRSIIDERKIVEVRCEFCNKLYVLDAVDAEQLFAATTLAQAQPTRH